MQGRDGGRHRGVRGKTRDRFEIHMSDEAALRHGFPASVAHGLLVLSLVDGLKNNAVARFRAGRAVPPTL
ncbi:MaoC/PaaZ C-terminal domain-containing protein [Mesorhizobium sp.]|uniref:MaoC/PaaZ C-terminal domain-containing protein n=1 Tax=Mesorhizobium sp. TaxID=1871066 RepID=UPI0034279E3A